MMSVELRKVKVTASLLPETLGQPPYKVICREIGCVASEEMNKVPVVECAKSDVQPKPVSMPCAEVKKKLELSPTVPCLYFREDLFLLANRVGLTISEKSAKPKRRHNCKDLPLTFASSSWFYEMKESKLSNQGKPLRQLSKHKLKSKRLLLLAHQSAALKVKKLTDMYEVEYIADFRMMQVIYMT